MDQPVKPADFARAVRIMHGAMVAGLALVGATFFLLLRVRQWQSLGTTPSLGVAFAGLGGGLLAVAVVVVRRRVPSQAGRVRRRRCCRAAAFRSDGCTE